MSQGHVARTCPLKSCELTLCGKVVLTMTSMLWVLHNPGIPLADDSEVVAQTAWNSSPICLLICHCTMGLSSFINIVNTISFLFWSQSKSALPWWPKCWFFQCKSTKNSGHCLWLAKMLILLYEHVAKPCTWRDIASQQSFVPATCPKKFNKLNFTQHVAGTKL